jgi:hypothetical protein
MRWLLWEVGRHDQRHTHTARRLRSRVRVWLPLCNGVDVMPFLVIGFFALAGVAMLTLSDRRRDNLMAESVEIKAALKSGMRRLNEMHIERFNADRERGELEWRLKEADETIRRLQRHEHEDTRIVEMLNARLRDAEARLARFKRERGEDGRWLASTARCRVSTSNPPYTGGAA